MPTRLHENVIKIANIILGSKTPSEYFNEPVIGVIEVEDIVGEGSNPKYDVIKILKNIYVTNQWYKEYKHIPQIIHKQLVIKFTPKK